MRISEAMEKIATIQRGLTVSTDGLGLNLPDPYAVKQAYAYVPSGRMGQISTPCWLNTASFDRQTGSNGQRTQFYTVRPQMILAELGSDLEHWTKVAWLFHEAFVDAMGQSLTLGEGSALQNVRGASTESGSGTVVVLTWNDTPYVGLDYLAELILMDNFEWRA